VELVGGACDLCTAGKQCLKARRSAAMPRAPRRLPRGEPFAGRVGQTDHRHGTLYLAYRPRRCEHRGARIGRLVIKRLRNLSLARRHPRSFDLSQYIDGDLDAHARSALEAHLRGCPRCRRELGSLANTVRALGSFKADAPDGLAESIIEALRAEDPSETGIGRQRPNAAGVPPLTLVPRAGRAPTGEGILNCWPQEARVALRWCLQSPQLRLTVPITLVAGVVLTMVNMGGMLMHGKIDLGVCVSCAIDFLVPFLALNLGLLMLLRLPRRRRL
jgi:hypothetical protein